MRWDLPQTTVGVLGQYYGPHMMGGWWWMWLVWIGGFFILVLVIYLLVYGLRNESRTPELSRETPLDILKKRYARGEITREEYERIKRDLEG